MEVNCKECNAKLNIPDEKIPKDQQVSISCPKCKNRIIIEPSNNSSSSTADHGLIPLEENDEDLALEYYEDTELALVLTDDATAEKIRSSIEEKEYRVVTTPTVREALLKLRLHHFDLIVLSENFDGQEDLAGGPVMNYLNHLSMSTRRNIFLTLIGSRFKTMDEMMAYSLSANMVVNIKDLESFPVLLKRGIQEYKKFYKVFLDTLEEEGKI